MSAAVGGKDRSRCGDRARQHRHGCAARAVAAHAYFGRVARVTGRAYSSHT